MRPLVFSDTITIRTDAELRAAIDAAAAREAVSASDLLRRTLRVALLDAARVGGSPRPRASPSSGGHDRPPAERPSPEPIRLGEPVQAASSPGARVVPGSGWLSLGEPEN